MMKTVTSELNRTAQDDKVKITVMTGAGNFYSSGNDFNPSEDFDIVDGLRTFQ